MRSTSPIRYGRSSCIAEAPRVTRWHDNELDANALRICRLTTGCVARDSGARTSTSSSVRQRCKKKKWSLGDLRS
jgi:hypothetical protein